MFNHSDLIHSISYDYYGQRLATCSSDQTIKVFDQNESGEWEENDSWRAHDATILDVAWANPETGQVIVSCSMDRSVRIYEELTGESRNSGKRWIERARLVDARGGVRSIGFAPAHFGLRLASVAMDGLVRVYEALEPNNLAHWTLMDDFRAVDTAVPRGEETSFCLSWAKSSRSQIRMVVGAMKKCHIWTRSSEGRWNREQELEGHEGLVRDVAWAPMSGRTYELVATACKDGHVRIYRLQEDNVKLIADLPDHGAEVWKVSWNVTGTILSSAGDDGR